MAGSIPEAFYHGSAWKACRAAYLQQHPFCEDCLAVGVYTPAVHVHHLIELNEGNYRDAAVSLNPKRLRALCIECHNKRHAKGNAPTRYTVDELGRIAPL